jgi:hypothetical protein
MCASIQVKMQTSLSMYQGTSWAKVAISLWALHRSGLLIPEMGPDQLLCKSKCSCSIYKWLCFQWLVFVQAPMSYKSLRDCRLCEVGVCDYAGAFAKRHLPAMRLSDVGC